MPVDPKYSGLPGIAWDQPDTFETVEGEGDDDSNDNTDTEPDEQEKLHMSSLSWLGDMEVGVEQVGSALHIEVLKNYTLLGQCSNSISLESLIK